MARPAIRKCFGMSGRLVERFPICSTETFLAWKAGKLVYFDDEDCFASLDLTEERDQKIATFEVDGYQDDEWKEAWEAMSKEKKEQWYRDYIRKHYKIYTYEEFHERDDVFHMIIPVTIHFQDGDIVGIIFGIEKPAHMAY